MPNLEERPGLSKIRERSLKQLLDQRAAYREKARDTELALQDRRALGLSPLELELQRQALAFHEARVDELDGLIKQVRKQNADIAADRAAHPLRPAGRREVGNNAAILGILERERRRNAPLSRGAYARAQATAASRSKFDLKQAYRLSGSPLSQDASFRGEASFYDLRGVSVDTPAGVDPCVEYRRVQANRREVMFAKGLMRGYSVAHRRSPC